MCLQVMLQVKQLRLILEGVDSTRMHLEVRGEGVVTASGYHYLPRGQNYQSGPVPFHSR